MCKVVAIAEPRNAVREHYAKYFEVDAGLVFTDWKEVRERGHSCHCIKLTITYSSPSSNVSQMQS